MKRIRIDIEIARRAFDDRGYTLLENEYKSDKVKMRYKCSLHPNEELSISYGNLRSGYGCKHCGSESRVRKRSHSFEYVIGEFSNRGYELLETEYINSSLKMRYLCPKHPDKAQTKTFASLMAGSGCKPCGYEIAKNKQKEDYITVIRHFKKRNYELLENVYTNAHAKMKYRCPNHPNLPTFITYHDLKKGQGCKYCFDDNRKGANTPNWKGGITNIKNHLRYKTKGWKTVILKEHDFKCFITGHRGGDLEVHHIKPFHNMVSDAHEHLGVEIKTQVNEYSEDVLNMISDFLDDEHVKYAGVPISRNLHILFHSIYGYDTSHDDLFDFKSKFEKGEIKYA